MNGELDFTTTFGSSLRGILQGLPLKFCLCVSEKIGTFSDYPT